MLAFSLCGTSQAYFGRLTPSNISIMTQPFLWFPALSINTTSYNIFYSLNIFEDKSHGSLDSGNVVLCNYQTFRPLRVTLSFSSSTPPPSPRPPPAPVYFESLIKSLRVIRVSAKSVGRRAWTMSWPIAADCETSTLSTHPLPA